MKMIFGATCRNHMDILGVGERGYVAPQLLRLRIRFCRCLVLNTQCKRLCE